MTVPGMVVGGTLTLDTIERDGVVHRDVPGGSALYAAAAASLLLPVRVAGVVGTDFPMKALEPLWARGVDPGAITVVEGPTFRWHARYEPGGDRRVTLARDPGVSAGRMPATTTMAHSNHALFLGSMDPALQAHLRAACPGARPVGLDSMRHWWDGRSEALHALLRQVDVAFMDEGELALATGTPDPLAGARTLLDHGPERVVVKRGSRGAGLLRRDRAPLSIGVVPVAVADPTGAGDAFAGAFIAALACRPDGGDDYALRFATAVASFAVEALGTRGLVSADLRAVEARMERPVVTAD